MSRHAVLAQRGTIFGCAPTVPGLLITGPTGMDKAWLACALSQQACRQGISTLYQRVPRLTDALRIDYVDGSFGRLLAQLVRTDVLLLDD